MQILSIDVGIVHLAMIKVVLESDYLSRSEVILDREITMCDLVDTVKLVSDCQDPDCDLYHDKIICDYMTHLFKKYKSVFESSDVILIERQPFTGLVAVQELIMKEYRYKSILVSPSAMLNSFGILHLEYDDRKVQTEKIAKKYLSDIKMFMFSERRHDMADALCILYYYLSRERKKAKQILEDLEFKRDNSSFISNIQRFKYNPGPDPGPVPGPDVSTSQDLKNK